MPFNSSGVYTPPTGAENALPGQIIRSATWNSIFTDIATALTQLGEASWVATPVVLSSSGSNYTIAPTDAVIVVAASTPTIVLPLASTKKGPVRVLGGASTIFGSANTVLAITGGDSISGLSAITLSTNYQTIALYPVTGGYLFY
jgi:hypothetical protein